MKPTTHLPIATPNPLRVGGGGAWSLTSAKRALEIIDSAIAQRERLLRQGDSGLTAQDVARPARELKQWRLAHPNPQNVGHASITAFAQGPLMTHLRTLMPSTAAGDALLTEFQALLSTATP